MPRSHLLFMPWAYLLSCPYPSPCLQEPLLPVPSSTAHPAHLHTGHPGPGTLTGPCATPLAPPLPISPVPTVSTVPASCQCSPFPSPLTAPWPISWQWCSPSPVIGRRCPCAPLLSETTAPSFISAHHTCLPGGHPRPLSYRGPCAHLQLIPSSSSPAHAPLCPSPVGVPNPISYQSPLLVPGMPAPP